MATTSDMTQALKMSASGMAVQSKRLLVISQNLANAETRAPYPGADPYRRKTISFTNRTDPKTGASTVQVKSVGQDQSPFKTVYSPGDPAADKNGMVSMPNVNTMVEMADMREAGLSHEANLRAYEKTLKMMEETVGLLKN